MNVQININSSLNEIFYACKMNWTSGEKMKEATGLSLITCGQWRGGRVQRPRTETLHKILAALGHVCPTNTTPKASPTNVDMKEYFLSTMTNEEILGELRKRMK